MENNQKVLFVQNIGNDEYEIESLWCIKDGDNYIVDNIPFIAKRVSLGDTIKAEFDTAENAYYFDDFVAVSGNTTLRIYFKNEQIIEDVRHQLNNFGCSAEIFLARKILSVNVPGTVDYAPVKQYLDEGEQKEKWQYEESCLAHE
ncbi:MAG: hypothetical protein JWR61_1213 [Ferruginibacter sp.]|uniref:DUF4265 domain-containing protein n=1 Tax=Ferruginibacter sp. TaxID=1940288 RepID=UPI0026586B1A|nr:DUF4265 domain-containing protein [Ferruginibacter sp.]MDB5276258.1 hypothetical protein [Ferruginibacter sp.]